MLKHLLQLLSGITLMVTLASCSCDRTETIEISGQLVESCANETPISDVIIEYSTAYDGIVYDTTDSQGRFKLTLSTEKRISLWTVKQNSLYAYRTVSGVVADTVRIAQDIFESRDLHQMAWRQQVYTSFDFSESLVPFDSSDSLYVFVMSTDFSVFSRARMVGPIDSTTVLDSVALVFPPHTGYFHSSGTIEIWIGASPVPYDDILYKASLSTIRGNIACMDYVQPLLFEDY